MTVEEIGMMAELRALECERTAIEAVLKVYAAQASTLITGSLVDHAMSRIADCQRELVNLASRFMELSEVAEASEEAADGSDSDQ